MDSERLNVECRVAASATGPTLHVVALTEGRAARGGLAELFVRGACIWPEAGIGVVLEHRGAAVTTAVPTRTDAGEIRIAAPATPEVFAAVAGGRNRASVEFKALAEVRTAGGVREIMSALIEAVCLTDNPEYAQTSAEVRTKRRFRWR